MDFSVLMPIYGGDCPEHADAAINSIMSQTRIPEEIMIIEDGPISDDLQEILISWENEYEHIFQRFRLSRNRGIGFALREGVKRCRNELIARMDADDISHPSRFEVQLDYIKNNKNVDVVGGFIEEIPDNSNRPTQIRKVPTSPDAIRTFARYRSPLNHVTVMFRKDSVLAAGSYRGLRSMQDYELWLRMLNKGYTLSNIPKVLVKVRSRNLYQRRGGWKYAKIEWWLQNHLRRNGYISNFVFLRNICTRVPIRFLPPAFRKLIYESLFREKWRIGE
jgi:glycosyltransferase involved in cell wall biosynthesis